MVGNLKIRMNGCLDWWFTELFCFQVCQRHMFSNIYVLICIFHLLLHNIMSYSDELSHDREAHKVNQSYMCYLGNPRSFMENNIGLSTCFRPYIFSRMRSEGFPFIVGVWGWTCVRFVLLPRRRLVVANSSRRRRQLVNSLPLGGTFALRHNPFTFKV